MDWIMDLEIRPILDSDVTGRLVVLRFGRHLHCYRTFVRSLTLTGTPIYTFDMFELGTIGLCLSPAVFDDGLDPLRYMFVLMIGGRVFFDVHTDLESYWELR